MHKIRSSKSDDSVNKETRLGFFVGDQRLFGIIAKNIGNEMIIKPTFPIVSRHLSFFPLQDTLGHQVTHEKYPKGNYRRHTQRKKTNPLIIVNAFFKLLEISTDPAPLLVTLEDINQNQNLIDWLSRNLSRIIRPTSEKNVLLMKDAIGDFVEKMLNLEDGATKIDFASFFESKPFIKKEQDLIELIKENELASKGRRIGFSPDFSTLIILVDGSVMELSVESINKFMKTISSELGINGYLRSIER